MWILSQENPAEIALYIVTNGATYTAGRSNCDFVLGGDKSVSRSHASFRIREGALHMTSLKPQLKTFVNGVVLEANVAKVLRHGDKVQIGTIYKFIVEKIEYTVCTSNMVSADKMGLSDTMAPYGINLVGDLSPDCTHLTIKHVFATAKVLSAVMLDKPIVTMRFWSDLAKRIDLHKLRPLEKDYFPPVDDANYLRSDFEYKSARQTLFKDMRFIFAEDKWLRRMKLIIEAGCGTCLTNNDCDRKDYNDTTTPTFVVQSTQSQQMGSQSGCRVITECDIIHSVMKVSNANLHAISVVGENKSLPRHDSVLALETLDMTEQPIVMPRTIQSTVVKSSLDNDIPVSLSFGRRSARSNATQISSDTSNSSKKRIAEKNPFEGVNMKRSKIVESVSQISEDNNQMSKPLAKNPILKKPSLSGHIEVIGESLAFTKRKRTGDVAGNSMQPPTTLKNPFFKRSDSNQTSSGISSSLRSVVGHQTKRAKTNENLPMEADEVDYDLSIKNEEPPLASQVCIQEYFRSFCNQSGSNNTTSTTKWRSRSTTIKSEQSSGDGELDTSPIKITRISVDDLIPLLANKNISNAPDESGKQASQKRFCKATFCKPHAFIVGWKNNSVHSIDLKD